MKFNYKVYLVLCIVFMLVFIAMVISNWGNRYIFLGLTIGAGLRSLYEYFKNEKQTPVKDQ